MIRGYPGVHKNPKSKIFLGKDDLSQKMRGMRVPWWRFLTDVTLLGKNLNSPSWLLLPLREKRNEEERWKEGRRRRMRRGNGEMKCVCCGEEEEEGWRGESCGLVCGWEKIKGGGISGGWERKNKEQENFKLFQISNYEREFHKIHINRGRERIFQPMKGCVSSRGATFWGEISILLKGCLKKQPVKMWGCHLKGFN